MNGTEIISPKSNTPEPNFRTPGLSRARFLKIRARYPTHYEAIFAAFGAAEEMPLEPIANVALQIGDQVDESPEIETSLREGWEAAGRGPVRRGNGLILLRKKSVSISQAEDTIEGIGVYPLNEEPTQLPSTQPPSNIQGFSQHDAELLTNPYLKKAA